MYYRLLYLLCWPNKQGSRLIPRGARFGRHRINLEPGLFGQQSISAAEMERRDKLLSLVEWFRVPRARVLQVQHGFVFADSFLTQIYVCISASSAFLPHIFCSVTVLVDWVEVWYVRCQGNYLGHNLILCLKPDFTPPLYVVECHL